jgi:D-sedoheptulose 7-phosphate isomerase
MDVAQVVAGTFRSGGRLFVAGADEQRSDVAHMTVEVVHPVLASARGFAVHPIDTDELAVQGRVGDACVVFARSTVDTAYRRTVEAARTIGMITIALVPGVGLPDGRADRVLGVGGRGKESFLSTYHALWEIVQLLLARDTTAPE